MRFAAFIPAIYVAALATSCGETGPVAGPRMPESGKVVVYVHWDGQGLPDKRVELVELHLVLTTNDAGLAEFVAPIGDYTLRAYDINRGGPALRYIDTDVTITADKELRVEIVDCLPCV